MSFFNPPERVTQDKVIALFQYELGYTFYGNLQDRTDNRNIREAELTAFLQEQGHNATQISRALYALQSAAAKTGNLYDNNKAVYELLRYGASVTAETGAHSETVAFINWQQPEKNQFGIAEEVTLIGENTRRPDLVLYINGIAVGVIELKRAGVSLTEAIGQCRSAQQDRFAESFFNTIQLVMAGNESEGLRYGTTKTEARFFLHWHEEKAVSLPHPDLYVHLGQLCKKERLLQLIVDFVLFDKGTKKLPRPHQFFATNAALDRINRREGGIIWHTQGSGKSLTMVYVARCVLESMHDARIMIVTDRDELDQQIKDVFAGTNSHIVRATSGRELQQLLAEPQHRIISTLVHKFGRRGVDDFEQLVDQLRNHPPPVYGRLVVFVDECHRTQSGRLHRLMKAMLPDAVFIGFTGTPLLKQDKATSHEVFGTYIHTYKFNQAVRDGVVLDLQYEARDIEQLLSSPERVDHWFDTKTAGLNDFQKALLRKKWGTLQKVLSSASRMEKIVRDITYDFSTRPRLMTGRGNALLVAGSIYQACRYYELFNRRDSVFRGRCAIITSYEPNKRDITVQDMDDHSETEREYIYNTYEEILAGRSTEEYEQTSKKKFLEAPAQMQLLIVVDKLLTGFDAPSCTYLYIDKQMQDHGLFQAICRVNRLDSDDKLFGFVVDYKGLFPKMEKAVSVYTSELDAENFSLEDCQVLLDDRRRLSRERLEKALEELARHCEPVPAPRNAASYQQYFCGHVTDEEEQKIKTPLRHLLYRLIRNLASAYNALADGYITAGYTKAEFGAIGRKAEFYTELFELLRRTTGEELDTRPYEADMRYMIDNFINASDSKVLASFGETGILKLLAQLADIDSWLQEQPQLMRDAQTINEVVEQNIRLKISRESMLNPAYYANISALLQQVLEEEKRGALTARQKLEKLKEIAQKLLSGDTQQYPATINTGDLRTLYNNLGQNEELVLNIDRMLTDVCADDWRNGNTFNQKEIKAGLYRILGSAEETERLYVIIRDSTRY